nr:protein FAM172A isoform X10 [Pogona vitticeps]XP_020648928.1 protein FAM172A isoform X11 [Pogona vitticeps]
MHIFFVTLIWLRIWISMAQLQQGGPDEKEKTTALKDLLSRIDLDELMKKDEPPLEFPDTLEGFEYAFNEKGQLRHIKTGEPFVFNYREDLHRWNQKRYEALGEIITKYVYKLLEEECHLKKVYVPVDAVESEPRSFIFMSEDAMTNPDKLMVLIHGSGVVRAGQWARRLIINEDLDSGTQIPYIKRAIEEGYGVIVLNPNENYIEVEKTKALVQLSPDSSDEPAEKREKKDKIQKDTKKRRDFYEKYRNPQKEKETVQLYIRRSFCRSSRKFSSQNHSPNSPSGLQSMRKTSRGSERASEWERFMKMAPLKNMAFIYGTTLSPSQQLKMFFLLLTVMVGLHLWN